MIEHDVGAAGPGGADQHAAGLGLAAERSDVLPLKARALTVGSSDADIAGGAAIGSFVRRARGEKVSRRQGRAVAVRRNFLAKKRKRMTVPYDYGPARHLPASKGTSISPLEKMMKEHMDNPAPGCPVKPDAIGCPRDKNLNAQICLMRHVCLVFSCDACPSRDGARVAGPMTNVRDDVVIEQNWPCEDWAEHLVLRDRKRRAGSFSTPPRSPRAHLPG